MLKTLIAAGALALSIATANACTTESDLRALIAKDTGKRYEVDIVTGVPLADYHKNYDHLANVYNKTEGKKYFSQDVAKMMLVYAERMPSRVFIHVFKKDGCEFWRGYIPTKHHREVMDLSKRDAAKRQP